MSIGDLNTQKNIKSRKPAHEPHDDAPVTETDPSPRGLSNNDLFSAVADSTRDGIIMMDSKGYVSYWNPASEKILGYRAEEVIGKDLHKILAPERYLQLHREALTVFQKTGKGRAVNQTLELEACHKNGLEISIELSLSAIKRSGTFHAIGIVRDITDRKKAEEELKKSEERFKALHNASFGGIAIHDKGVILDCNNGLSEISGYTVNELTGMNGLLLIAEQSRDEVMKNIRKGFEKPYEVRGRRKDGSEYPLRLEAKNIPHKDKEVRVVEFRDISDQERLRKKQELLQKQLLQSQKVESIGRLAGGVAHDLNNLLSPILGYGELLLDSLELSDKQRRQLGIILDAASRSRDLVKQLLAFSRKQELEVKAVNLNIIIGNIQQLLRRIIPEDVLIDLNLSSDKCIIMADRNQIEQVIVNLTVNAADTMPDGGKISIETSLVCGASPAPHPTADHPGGRFVVLSIRDSGKGIEREILSQIFEPFFSTKGEQGTGLGLSTVYGIVKQHGGDIKVKSKVNEGSCFDVYLPCTDSSCIDKTDTEKREVQRLERGHETILIVEDNEHVRQLAQTLLKLQGYHVVTAEDGHDALNKAKQFKTKIDLLLTDVVMPEINGRDLSEKLTALMPSLKTLYMSGYTAQIIRFEAIQGGRLNFIQKPFSKTALAQKVRAVLDG